MKSLLTASTALLLAFPASPAAASDVDFLVPGVSLRSIEFTPGASVTYLVISEAHGIADSSLVTLTVTGDGPGGADLEVRSTTWPPVDSETVTVRLTLCSDAAALRTAEELRGCISGVLVKDGDEPFREPTEAEIEDFDMGRLFISRGEGMRRRELDPETVVVPAGEFRCEVVEYYMGDTRDVAMGGITAVRTEEETSVLMISPEIPFWGLVRSRVERTTSTRYPGGRRAREARPKVTVTESVLVEYSGPGASSPE